MTWTFEGFKASFFNEYDQLHPIEASALGLSDYDRFSQELTPEYMQAAAAFYAGRSQELEKHYYALHAVQERFEADIILWQLRYHYFLLRDEQAHTYNPFYYDFYLDYSKFLTLSQCAPPEDYIPGLIARLSAYPQVAQCMQNQLHAAAAPLGVFLSVLKGYHGSITADVAPLQQGLAPDQAHAFATARHKALHALSAMIDFVEDRLAAADTLPGYALGRQRLQKLLYFMEGKDENLDHLLTRGERELARVAARGEVLAKELNPGFSFYDALDHLAEQQPPVDGVLQRIQDLLGEVAGFIRRHHLVALDDLSDLSVEAMPPYWQWAAAMMNTPGPLETRSLPSHFYVTLPAADWDAQQVARYMKGFSNALLENLVIHEALPGHYLHYVYQSRLENMVARRTYGYGFTEGWAHYCEEMMVAEGFGRTPHAELAKLREQALRLVRLITAIKLHTNRFSLTDAQEMFAGHCYLDTESAKAEAMRGTFDPAYLLYTYGKWCIQDLRAGKGAHMAPQQLHEALLSLGAPPLGLLEKYFAQIRF